MKSGFYGIASLIALALVLGGCKDDKTKLQEMKKKREELTEEINKLEKMLNATDTTKESRLKQVAVVPVAPVSFDHFIKTQGSVEAIDNIQVTAKMMGVISVVRVREGEVVTKGQILAEIDNSVTLRSIDELKSAIELATTVYQRQKNLWDQKIGTEVQYLQAKNNKESLEKRMATLQEQLDMSRIKSPINGSVDEVSVKIGQGAQPGAPAFRVVSFDKLKMRASISEAYVTNLKPGNKTRIRFPDINEEFDATVTFVGKTINQLSRSFTVEVALPSRPNLRPNMTGELRVIYETVPNALTVPINVVQDVNGQKVVYVAEVSGANTIARKKVVEVLGVFDNQAEVKGVTAGDRVITVGYQGLTDGQQIKI